MPLLLQCVSRENAIVVPIGPRRARAGNAGKSVPGGDAGPSRVPKRWSAGVHCVSFECTRVAPSGAPAPQGLPCRHHAHQAGSVLALQNAATSGPAAAQRASAQEVVGNAYRTSTECNHCAVELVRAPWPQLLPKLEIRHELGTRYRALLSILVAEYRRAFAALWKPDVGGAAAIRAGARGARV